MEDLVAQKLTDILRAHIPDDGPTCFTLDNRLEALGIDSLGLSEAIFEIEEEFDIAIPEPEELEEAATQFQTVNDLVIAVKELMSQKREAQS